MSRRLIAINAGLVVIAIVAVAITVREFRTPPPPATRRARPPAAPVVTAPPPAPPAPGAYAVVASRNLFSPTRSEAPAGPSASAAPPVAKPHLYGIILREGAPVAYLEDPTTKRVAGYRLGDSVAGGTIKKIGNDHVVLNRPDGDVNVRLRDPAKPRPPMPPAAGTRQPPGAPPAVAAPGGPPPVPGGQPPKPPQPGQAVTPGAPVPGMPSVLPRRPLPPNLLRRLPQPAAPDAPARN